MLPTARHLSYGFCLILFPFAYSIRSFLSELANICLVGFVDAIFVLLFLFGQWLGLHRGMCGASGDGHCWHWMQSSVHIPSFRPSLYLYSSSSSSSLLFFSFFLLWLLFPLSSSRTQTCSLCSLPFSVCLLNWSFCLTNQRLAAELNCIHSLMKSIFFFFFFLFFFLFCFLFCFLFLCSSSACLHLGFCGYGCSTFFFCSFVCRCCFARCSPFIVIPAATLLFFFFLL